MQQLIQDRQDKHVGDGDEDRPNDRKSNEMDDFERYTMEVDDSGEGEYHRSADINQDLHLGATEPRQTYLKKIKVPEKLPDEEYHELLARLNRNQRLLLTDVMHHGRNNKDVTTNRYFDTSVAPPSNNTFSPLHILATGGAGTGKSMLIKALYQSLIREFDHDRTRNMKTPSVLLCAPTGVAACNIGGQTLHSTFQFPNNQSILNRLSADVSHSMSVALKDLKFVITDEISMVSIQHFDFIDKRLKDMFDPNKPFDGNPWLNSEANSANRNTIVELLQFDNWSLFKPCKLTEIMRQSEDRDFAIAAGAMTKQDIRLMQSRVYNLPPEQARAIKHSERIDVPADANGGNKPMILCKSNKKEASAFNNLILGGIDGDGADWVAFDQFTCVLSLFKNISIQLDIV